MGLFRKEAPPPDPVDRFFDAIQELNSAWEALPDSRLRPWIDWVERKVVATYAYQPEAIKREDVPRG